MVRRSTSQSVRRRRTILYANLYLIRYQTFKVYSFERSRQDRVEGSEGECRAVVGGGVRLFSLHNASDGGKWRIGRSNLVGLTSKGITGSSWRDERTRTQFLRVVTSHCVDHYALSMRFEEWRREERVEGFAKLVTRNTEWLLCRVDSSGDIVKANLCAGVRSRLNVRNLSLSVLLSVDSTLWFLRF